MMAKYIVCLFLFFTNGLVHAQDTFRLAPPLLRYKSEFFSKPMEVTLLFAQTGTAIRYTLNGNEPSENDTIYKAPLTINNHLTTVKAKAFGYGFLPSETVSATFVKDGYTIISATPTPPNPKYPGNGSMALFDKEGGVANVNSPLWLGYQKDTVAITVYLQRKQTISSILLSMLQDHSARVFLPQQVSVYYFDERANKFKSCFNQTNPASAVTNGSITKNYIISLSKKVKTGILKVVMVPVQSLPEKHPGHGTPGWLFIDEIKVY